MLTTLYNIILAQAPQLPQLPKATTGTDSSNIYYLLAVVVVMAFQAIMQIVKLWADRKDNGKPELVQCGSCPWDLESKKNVENKINGLYRMADEQAEIKRIESVVARRNTKESE